MKRPTVLSLFCGLGGGTLGFTQAGFKSAAAIDSDEHACHDFEAITGESATRADLASMTPQQLRSICPASPDVVMASPPCLPSDELVITEDGPRPISTVRAGDRVLTHKGRYKAVRAVGRHMHTEGVYSVRLNGSATPRKFTGEHPIYVRRTLKKVPGTPARMGEAQFVRADEVRVGDRVGFPIVEEVLGTAAAFVRRTGDPQLVERRGLRRGTDGRKPCVRHKARIPKVVDLSESASSRALWYVLGVYLGDGFRRKDRTNVIFCVGAEGGKLDVKLREALDELGLGYVVTRHGGESNIKVRVSSRHLWLITEMFGDGAQHKFIPEELFALERTLIEALWAGYLDSDGSIVSKRSGNGGKDRAVVIQATSVSLGLLEGIQRLLLALGLWSSVGLTWAGGEQTIMGRVVHTKPRWELRLRVTPCKKRRVAEFDGGMVWTRVRAVEHEPSELEVWNLDVDEDDTFCVHMIATHNCKGFSSCLAKDRGSSSEYAELNSLVERAIFLALSTWEVPPKLIVMENVPRIQSRGAAWLTAVDGMLAAHGYAVHRSSHCCGELGGLAQRRRRYLVVARHTGQVPEWLYRPPKQRVRGIGEVLSALPSPAVRGAPSAGPLHELDRLWDVNWLRLACTPAGSDWRALPGEVALPSGHAADISRGCSPRSGTYGVRGSGEASATVIGNARVDTGPFAWADPRIQSFGSGSDGPTPAATHRVSVGPGTRHRLEGPELDLGSKDGGPRVIESVGGAWHRPMTTLELAALQGLPLKRRDGSWLELSGSNKRQARVRVGNAVPPPSARAIAEICMETLEAAAAGRLLLSGSGVWVTPHEPSGGPKGPVHLEMDTGTSSPTATRGSRRPHLERSHP